MPKKQKNRLLLGGLIILLGGALRELCFGVSVALALQSVAVLRRIGGEKISGALLGLTILVTLIGMVFVTNFVLSGGANMHLGRKNVLLSLCIVPIVLQ